MSMSNDQADNALPVTGNIEINIGPGKLFMRPKLIDVGEVKIKM